jgi:hypothetical protein
VVALGVLVVAVLEVVFLVAVLGEVQPVLEWEVLDRVELLLEEQDLPG